MTDPAWTVTWADGDGFACFDMPRPPEPLDVCAPETFDRWLCANDGRTLEEFAADVGGPLVVVLARSPDQRPDL